MPPAAAAEAVELLQLCSSSSCAAPPSFPGLPAPLSRAAELWCCYPAGWVHPAECGQEGGSGIPAGWGRMGKGSLCFRMALDPKNERDFAQAAPSAASFATSPLPRTGLSPAGFFQDFQPFIPVCPFPVWSWVGHLSAEFQMFTPLSTQLQMFTLFYFGCFPISLSPFLFPSQETGTPWIFFPICVLILIPVPEFCPAWCRN